MAFELSSLRFSSSKKNAAEAVRTRPRVASEELVVPGVETASPVYYGVDTFSPTLVDLYTADEKRIVWSSRAHRKMMTTLFRSWHGKQWKLYSLGFWSGLCSICGNSLLLAGCIAEVTSHASSISTNEMHRKVDQPLFYGVIFYLLTYILNHFEVINSCHNLEVCRLLLWIFMSSLTFVRIDLVGGIFSRVRAHAAEAIFWDFSVPDRFLDSSVGYISVGVLHTNSGCRFKIHRWDW